MTIFDSIETFQDEAGQVCAQIQRGGRLDVLNVSSEEFEDWLVRHRLEKTGKVLKSSAINNIVKVLRAQGQTKERRKTFVRFAAPNSGTVFLDLATRKGEVARVDAHGWEVVQNPDLPFRRPAGMRELPHPERGGALSDLRPLLNAREERNWVLMVGFLVSTLMPVGTLPVLVLEGEQGSLKSGTSRTLGSLVDPRKGLLRRMSRSERDLMVAAGNAHVLAFDNVSELTGRLSDAICSLVSGGGFTTRKLYTNRDETIIEARRPVILNGIAGIVQRDDLADRALQLTLPPIPKEERRSERWVRSQFEDIRPQVLGALLDAVSCALQRYDQVDLEQQPRLADLSQWVRAAEPSLPWSSGRFMKALKANRRAVQTDALRTNPLARAVATVVDGTERWNGTPTSLLNELEQHVPDRERRRHSDWPASASWVWRKLQRVKPLLRRAAGIELTRSRSADRREIVISRQHDGNDGNPISREKR